MSSTSRTPSLTPSRSPSPSRPVQPVHFYGSEDSKTLPSPSSDGKTWLDPEDDPLAHRGIPVFKPSMAEFENFEAYMNSVECWGAKSGIIKIIPPKEWIDALPPLKEPMRNIKIKTPIEQHMFGHNGLFRQENMEKRKHMSVREWVELCSKDEFRAPGVHEVGVHGRSANVTPKTTKRGKKAVSKAGSADPQIRVKDEPLEDIVVPVHDEGNGSVNMPIVVAKDDDDDDGKSKAKGRRQPQTKESREANLADRAAKDDLFLETFNPHTAWLPPFTTNDDYTPEFCHKLERQYWRNCGLGRSAWYGADSAGTLFTDETTAWNVGHLDSTLSRLLPSEKGLPGVNTPYLYWGMWRATFAWHVEDMDLFSINYIHFGAPKFWYSIPQGRAAALEQTMRGYFPKDTSKCPQFLRHKSFLASPTLLAKSSCRPNCVVQKEGEIIITFPRGYHAGFNLGLNCAESVNFALESWIALGRTAKACECVGDSVRIDVDQLIQERAEEAANPPKPPSPKKTPMKMPNKNNVLQEQSGWSSGRKRKMPTPPDELSLPSKKAKLQPLKPKGPKVTLKLGPRPPEPEAYPCCLCISTSEEGLLPVQDPPAGRKDACDAAGNPAVWLAHESCANIVPETWVDEIEGEMGGLEKVVFGVDGIVKDRWHLKCSACTKTRPKGHGAPIQCTKGKCSKAFHVSCARNGAEHGIVFEIVREVEKEVVLLDPGIPDSASISPAEEGEGMVVDVVAEASGTLSAGHVLKIIKKLEVQVLCYQHNPAVAAKKKAGKQDKIRNELIALAPMSRIKIRVSAGVFEVSLVRVIEETTSVEVLWDRGIKKEFKWGSVIFGATDGPILQKPTEMAPDPPPRSIATASSNTARPVAGYFPNPYQYWAFPTAPGPAGSSTQFSYAYSQPGQYTSQSQAGSSTTQPAQSAQTWPQNAPRYYIPQLHTLPALAAASKVAPSSKPANNAAPTSTTGASLSPVTSNDISPPSSAPPMSSLEPPSPAPPVLDISALAKMTPIQLGNMLQSNPELRDAILASANQTLLATAVASKS